MYLFPLHWAVLRQPLEEAAASILNATDVNCVDDYMQTPLHAAASRKDGRPLVLLLLILGADRKRTSEWEHTPLDSAEGTGPGTVGRRCIYFIDGAGDIPASSACTSAIADLRKTSIEALEVDGITLEQLASFAQRSNNTVSSRMVIARVDSVGKRLRTDAETRAELDRIERVDKERRELAVKNETEVVEKNVVKDQGTDLTSRQADARSLVDALQATNAQLLLERNELATQLASARSLADATQVTMTQLLQEKNQLARDLDLARQELAVERARVAGTRNNSGL